MMAWAGAISASRPPATAGATRLVTEPAADSPDTACTTRPGPASVGTAPKLAASNHTNRLAAPSATSTTSGIVRRPNALATGIAAISAAQPRSQPTISRRRRTRSASAPASSPNAMYGSASTAASSEVSAGEPVRWYTSTGSTTPEIPLPAQETVRAAQNKAKAPFFFNGGPAAGTATLVSPALAWSP